MIGVMIMIATFFGLLCSYFAETKNRSRSGWFVVGFFFGLVGLLFALAAAPRHDRFAEVGVNVRRRAG